MKGSGARLGGQGGIQPRVCSGGPRRTKGPRGVGARGLLGAQGWRPPHTQPPAPLPSISPRPALSPPSCTPVPLISTLLHLLVPPVSLLQFLPHMRTVLLSRLRSCFLRAGLHFHLAMVNPPRQPGHRPCHPGGPDLVSPPSPEQEGGFPAPLPAQPPAQPGAAPCGQHAETGECPAQLTEGRLEGQCPST